RALPAAAFPGSSPAGRGLAQAAAAPPRGARTSLTRIQVPGAGGEVLDLKGHRAVGGEGAPSGAGRAWQPACSSPLLPPGVQMRKPRPREVGSLVQSHTARLLARRAPLATVRVNMCLDLSAVPCVRQVPFLLSALPLEKLRLRS
ncbi:hypothetical protein H1C71_017998, partial [Ictidomys tridecemlineatus]